MIFLRNVPIRQAKK